MSTKHFEPPSTPQTHQLAYTRREAARLLGISPNSLDRLVQRGLIMPSRALRRPLFTVEELRRFLNDTK